MRGCARQCSLLRTSELLIGSDKRVTINKFGKGVFYHNIVHENVLVNESRSTLSFFNFRQLFKKIILKFDYNILIIIFFFCLLSRKNGA